MGSFLCSGTQSGHGFVEITVKQRINEVSQIVKYRYGWPLRNIHTGLEGQLVFTGQDEYRHGPHCLGGIQVAKRITYCRHTIESGLQAMGNALEHTRQGFAASAVIVGSMGAEKHRIDSAALLPDALDHARVNAVHGRQIKQAPGYAGLIGCDHHTIVLAAQSGDGLKAPGNGFPFLGAFDEVAGVMVNDTVAIEYDKFHAPECNPVPGAFAQASIRPR